MNELKNAFEKVTGKHPLFMKSRLLNNLCASDRTTIVQAFCSDNPRVSDAEIAKYSQSNDIQYEYLVQILNFDLLTVWQQKLVNVLYQAFESNINAAFFNFLSRQDFKENYLDSYVCEFDDELHLDNISRAHDMNMTMSAGAL